MFGKLKFGLILAALFSLSACGSDWRSGEYEGTAKISAKSSYDGLPSVVVVPQRSRIKFPFSSTLKLEENTPIPNCTVTFAGGDIDSEHKLSGFDRAFKGDINGGQDCEAFLSKGTGTKVEFFEASVTRADSGEITVKLNFRPRDSTGDASYEFEFQGHKKGWF